eukprot:3738587-Prymnesium_polylepis.1
MPLPPPSAPSPPPPEPFPPLSPGQTVQHSVEQAYIIAGSVETFGPSEQESFTQGLSSMTGVPASSITLQVSAASVSVIATFQVESEDESSSVKAALDALAQSSNISQTLSVPVENVSEPIQQAVVLTHPPSSPPSSPPVEAAAVTVDNTNRTFI